MKRLQIRDLINNLLKDEKVAETFCVRTTKNLDYEEVREKEFFNSIQIDDVNFLFNKNKRFKILQEDEKFIEFKKNKDFTIVKNCVVYNGRLINKKTLNYFYLLDIIKELDTFITREDIEEDEDYIKRLAISSSSPLKFFKDAILFLSIKKIKKEKLKKNL